MFFGDGTVEVEKKRDKSLGTDLSTVITWVGLGLSAAELHTL
jgi:hypothetical protein